MRIYFLQTIFEIGTKTSSIDYQVMKTKRAFHKENILNFHKKIEERKVDKMDAELGEYCDTEMHNV